MLEKYQDILAKGAKYWNLWRAKNDYERLLLQGLEIIEQDTYEIEIFGSYGDDPIGSGGDLLFVEHGLDLSNCDLKGANFSGTSFTKAIFTNSDLTNVNFSSCKINDAKFDNAILNFACFDSAKIANTTFNSSDLSHSSFKFSSISSSVNMRESRLDYCNFFQSDVDISIILWAKSFIKTIFSKRKFILKLENRAARLPAEKKVIEKMHHDLEFYDDTSTLYSTCFISYSTKDEEFANRIYTDLVLYGVKCWFAPKSMVIGDKIRPTIFDAIKDHSKLLLILSNSSINSPWVENEVEAAIEIENRANKNLLFPIKIDNEIFETNQAWANVIRRQRHIGDFCKWELHHEYYNSLRQLLSSLEIK